MLRKVIIDCDPGIDDAVALCLALFEPKLEIVAVTAVEGKTSAERATRNVQAVIDQLDPPRIPRVGAAVRNEFAPRVHTHAMHGEDGLGNAGFAVSELHHQHSSEKIICDAVRKHPDEITIICLGPLTNLACAFQRDPELPLLVNQVVISGGSVRGGGSVTAAAEFNMYYDPESAQAIFKAPLTKTLIPLDVSKSLAFTLDFVESLPPEHSRVGRFLRRLLPYSFRAYRQHMGLESVYLPDVVALIAAIHPELFETVEMAADVETAGELTRGMTVIDQRRHVTTQPNITVAMDLDMAAVKDCILRGINEAGQAT